MVKRKAARGSIDLALPPAAAAAIGAAATATAATAASASTPRSASVEHGLETTTSPRRRGRKPQYRFTTTIDIALLQATLLVNPFNAAFGSVKRSWEQVADRLNTTVVAERLNTTVDGRRCRERVLRLLHAFRAKFLVNGEPASAAMGLEMSEIERLTGAVLDQLEGRVDKAEVEEDDDDDEDEDDEETDDAATEDGDDEDSSSDFGVPKAATAIATPASAVVSAPSVPVITPSPAIAKREAITPRPDKTPTRLIDHARVELPALKRPRHLGTPPAPQNDALELKRLELEERRVRLMERHLDLLEKRMELDSEERRVLIELMTSLASKLSPPEANGQPQV